MSNYYKYQKRDEPQLLDWDGVTKTLSDKVMKPIEDERKAKGQAAKLAQELGDYESKITKGAKGVKNQNEFFGSSIQLIGKVNADLANAYKQGKGEISAQEYNIQAQSLKSQYELFKNYQTKYLDRYEEYIKNVSENGNIQNAFAESVEGFGDLKNLKLEYKDGRLVLQRFDDLGDRTGEGQSIESLIGLTSFENSKFDNKAINDAKKTLTSVYQDTFGNTTVSDPTQNPTFDEALEGQVEAMLNGDHQIVEYLMGPGGYNKIETFKDFDPSQTGVIYMNTNDNGVPQIVPEQRDTIIAAARETLKNQLLGLMPRKETTKTESKGSKPTAKEVGASNTIKILNDLVTSSDLNEAGTAANAIVQQNNSIRAIDPVVSNGKVVKYKINVNGSNVDIDVQGKNSQEIIKDIYNLTDKSGAGSANIGINFDTAWKGSKISSKDAADFTTTEAFSFSPTAEDYSDLRMDATNTKNQYKGDINSDLGYWSQSKVDLNKSMKHYWKTITDQGSNLPNFLYQTAEITDFNGGVKVKSKNKRMPIDFAVPTLGSPQDNADLTSSLREALFNLQQENPQLKGAPEYNDYFYEKVKEILNNKNPNAFTAWAAFGDNSQLDK